MRKQIQLYALIALLAVSAFGQAAKQSELDKHLALQEEEIALMRNPANVEIELYEAQSDECKVRVYRLFLKVPARAASKSLPARKAATVVTQYKIDITYHIATTQRREAQMEAIMLGADPSDSMKIDREVFESNWNLNGNTTDAKLRYYAGTKVVASRDLMAGDKEERGATVTRMLKLDAWARAKSGN